MNNQPLHDQALAERLVQPSIAAAPLPIEHRLSPNIGSLKQPNFPNADLNHDDLDSFMTSFAEHSQALSQDHAKLIMLNMLLAPF